MGGGGGGEGEVREEVRVGEGGSGWMGGGGWVDGWMG